MNTDETYMARALQLAALAGVSAAPNPLVGAVIVHNNTIIGEGYHEKCGEAHAEVNAVKAVSNKSLLSESTIYVTLEPCAHYGKTPPCAELLVKHQFKRVVIATVDPFAAVAGKGIEMLKSAGIEVETGVLMHEAQELNKRFFTYHTKKRPYIFLKWAQTADGFIDAPRDEQTAAEIRWISQPETQVVTHKMRIEEQAILVGWRTILNDNPSLTARAFSGPNPLRIILDSELKAPKNAFVFTDGLPTIVLNTIQTETINNVRFIQLQSLDISNVLKALYDLQVTSVIIEGGAYTLNQFIKSDLWDEALIIKGASLFQQGLAAPIIATFPYSEIEFGKDKLLYYRNK